MYETNFNAESILTNYSINHTLKFDPSLNKYDTFSKKHHREKLFNMINQIDWENEYKIKLLKKDVNPYEDLFEEYFNRRSSYKMANMNSLFKFSLFTKDYVINFTPIMIIGDDGGYSDYLLWYSKNNDITVKIFAIPEKRNKISKNTFRKEIDDNTKKECLNIIELKKDCDIDEIEDLNAEKLKNLSDEIVEATDGCGISLFIAKKYLKFKKEFSQEIKYKKFLLINMILGLSVLTKGGNLIIKIYDMYTHFTASVLFLLFSYFEKFTIIKPFSIRPHTSARFVICQKLIEFQPKILKYLYELYDQYCNLLKIGKDIDYIFSTSKIVKDENFSAYLMEINSLIAEQRIESLEEIKKAFDGQSLLKFDKMDIKKKCLELWKVPILHYDPRLLISSQNILQKKKLSKKEEINKLSSLGDQDTMKIYSDYGMYSDRLKSMIEMFPDKTTVNILSDQKEKHDCLSYKPNMKMSKYDQLKQKIINDRNSEDYYKIVDNSNFTNQDELLNKKRELIMCSQSSKQSKSKNKNDIPSKKSIKCPNLTPKVLTEPPKLERLVKDDPRDITKIKEKAVEDSIKNRQLSCNTNKKVIPDEKLKLELEKYKKKNN